MAIAYNKGKPEPFETDKNLDGFFKAILIGTKSEEDKENLEKLDAS